MAHKFTGFRLQDRPPILVAVMPGQWLLKRTTPSWRIDDPVKGFQRRVSEDRAREIATAVLDEGRTFPNAIILATNTQQVTVERGKVEFPQRIRFLVVDGQHRLWAQHFCEHDAPYCCLVHLGLDETEMAHLFVEINDNQKRVPSSLRWDLVRLVRAEGDPHGVRAVDLLYDLNSTTGSALYQRVDLTGEQKEITLKQGSLAPAIKSVVGKRDSALHDESYETQLKALMRYFAAIRARDTDGWDDADGPLYRARVIRALLRLLIDILAFERDHEDRGPSSVTARIFSEYLKLVDLSSLDPEAIRGQQGSAGIRAIYLTVHAQVFE